MSTTVTFQGVEYSLPAPGDTDEWGAQLSAFLTALANAQPAAKFTLTGTSARAPLMLTPGSQPTGPNVIGDLYMTTAGVLKVCTAAGTPGTWVSVGAQT